MATARLPAPSGDYLVASGVRDHL